MLHDPYFYAFLIAALILGWVYGRFRHLVGPLYDAITELQLERDAQARTIQWQRRVIAQLEKRLERKPGDIFVTPEE